MNICFISPYSPRTVNGIGTFIVGLAEHLKKRNYGTFLITKYDESKIDIEEVFDSNNIIEIKHIKLKYFANIHFTLLTLVAIFRVRHKVDILHLQQSHMLSMSSAVFAKILGIPTVTTIHVKVPTAGFKRKIAGFFDYVVITFSDTITYVSEETEKSFKHPGKIIRNGTDTLKFKVNHSLRKKTRLDLNIVDDFVLLFLGRVASNKGIYEILDAIIRLKKNQHNNIKLLVVGPIASDEKNKYMNYIKMNNLKKNILNFGAQKDVQKYYCASDIFILPSYLEGLPLSLLEAMFSGLPCIASQVGGIPEVIIDGKNGLLIEPKSIDNLTQTITWCLNNWDKAEVIGANATKTIENRFSMERVTDEYMDVYRELVTA